MSQCEDQLGVSKDNMKFLNLSSNDPNANFSNEIALQINAPSLSLKYIEELIASNEKYKEQLKNAKESLSVLSEKLNEMNTDLSPEEKDTKLKEENSMLRKKLEEKEKKFKEFNKEAIQTVETLKKDFDHFILVQKICNIGIIKCWK